MLAQVLEFLGQRVAQGHLARRRCGQAPQLFFDQRDMVSLCGLPAQRGPVVPGIGVPGRQFDHPVKRALGLGQSTQGDQSGGVVVKVGGVLRLQGKRAREAPLRFHVQAERGETLRDFLQSFRLTRRARIGQLAQRLDAGGQLAFLPKPVDLRHEARGFCFLKPRTHCIVDTVAAGCRLRNYS